MSEDGYCRDRQKHLTPKSVAQQSSPRISSSKTGLRLWYTTIDQRPPGPPGTPLSDRADEWRELAVQRKRSEKEEVGWHHAC